MTIKQKQALLVYYDLLQPGDIDAECQDLKAYNFETIIEGLK